MNFALRIWCLILLGTSVSLSRATAQNLENGLVANLPLNGVVTDASGHGSDGVLAGGYFTNGIQGEPLGALHFSGLDSDGLVIADSPALLAGNLTVSVWLRATQVTRDLQIAIKSHSPNASSFQWSFYLGAGFGNNIGAPAAVMAILRNGSAYYFYSPPLVLTNQWVMLTGTWDGAAGQLYQNDQPMATTDYPRPAPPGPIDPNVGGEIHLGQSSLQSILDTFTGDFAHFRVYNRALSAAEVQALHSVEGAPGPNPSTATATATVVNGFVVALNLTSGGSGYLSTPVVALVGGGGDGAAAVATVTNGVVVALKLTSAGRGYTNVPDVVVAPPGGPLSSNYRPAKGFPTLANGFLVKIQITDPGSGYTNAPTVTILGGGGSGASAETRVTNGMVKAIQVTNAGSGYTNPPTILIAPPGPIAAAATAQVAGGFVVGTTLNYPGYGYTQPPQVSFIGGGGSGARAAAVVTNGLVVGLQVLNAGKGYTNAPIVRIDPPSSLIIPPTSLDLTVRSVRVAMHVVVGRSYALEMSDTLDAWSQVGDPFTAFTTPTSVDVEVGGIATYFRLRDLTYSP